MKTLLFPRSLQPQVTALPDCPNIFPVTPKVGVGVDAQPPPCSLLPYKLYDNLLIIKRQLVRQVICLGLWQEEERELTLAESQSCVPQHIRPFTHQTHILPGAAREAGSLCGKLSLHLKVVQSMWGLSAKFRLPCAGYCICP